MTVIQCLMCFVTGPCSQYCEKLKNQNKSIFDSEVMTHYYDIVCLCQ